MSDNLMLSITVETYNQEKYIAKTLDSILEQKHDYSYEIIIGEDCSSDNTKKIIESYVEKYPEIIKPIYNNPNLGLMKNYFNITKMCRGKYIMDVAGDDWWLPGKIKTQIEFMENNLDVAMCHGRAKYYIEENKSFSKNKVENNQHSFDELITQNNISALTTCIRRSEMQRYFDEVKPYEKDWRMEDLPQWLWYSLKSKIAFIDEYFGVYRILSESASHSVNMDKMVLYEKSVYDIKNFYLKNYVNRKTFEFDEHRCRAWNMARIDFFPAKDILIELKKISVLTKRDKLLMIVCSFPILLKLARLRWQ